MASTLPAVPPAQTRIDQAIGRSIAPRRALTVSEWADNEVYLSEKGSSKAGKWRTRNNPPLREPMDCMSARSSVREVVLMFPIQFGKTMVAVNTVGYVMDHAPCAIMVCLPGEVSLTKWVVQKLTPMLDETPAAKRVLTSVASRDSSNTRTFKDFQGGQIFLEHAGSPSRLKSTTVKVLIVDELDEFATSLPSGDDPVSMLEGRTSGFPSTYKRLYISTPQTKGASRTDEMWEASDQRLYHVPCPHCGHEQPLEWAGLHWTPDASRCWYVCRECGVCIEEHEKTAMIAAGRWIPTYPERKVRGYHINCLYYQIGLGPRWLELVHLWIAAQRDPAKLKTFINDRLAQAWESPAMRRVKQEALADRVEPYRLRRAPAGVLVVTAGVDTQDNRLAVHILGWGRGMTCWVLDYVELPGDPAEDKVWDDLTELLNRGIEHELGGLVVPEASAIDAGGHRTEAVKAYVRSRRIRRPLCIFGAKPNNAPVLSKGKLEDVNFRDQLDRRGVTIHHVGTVVIKHGLYARLSADADRTPDIRMLHLSDELSTDYLGGLVSEIYDPRKNRFVHRRGAPRNEPLDTWVYGYAAAYHPELRLHRFSKADWDEREKRIRSYGGAPSSAQSHELPATAQTNAPAVASRPAMPPANPFASQEWLKRR